MTFSLLAWGSELYFIFAVFFIKLNSYFAIMEANDPESKSSEKCNINGNCSPPRKKQASDYNHTQNIDDIATPSDLKFDEEFDFPDPDIIEKRKEIERCLEHPDEVKLEEWQQFARSKGGLISDVYRRKIWPLLVGVTKEEMTEPPSLEELSTHEEYNQVVLDVNRSLKRFPPGIPLERRLALQDQLTVLILRVILAYPELSYYQGYHDVAITLLLVCGGRAAFPLLSRLSAGAAAPLRPFMRRSMRAAQHTLNHLPPAIRRVSPKLADKLHRAGVGTMFALPWLLTWFGHSLPRYRDVVRLYDYFLAAPPAFPVYVTAAIVLYRQQEVMECEEDMAALHCLLSRLPDSLPFDDLLVSAQRLYDAHPPHELEADVLRLEAEEERQRRLDEERMRARAAARAGAVSGGGGAVARMRRWAGRCRGRRVALAAAIGLLAAAVYWRPELWNTAQPLS